MGWDYLYSRDRICWLIWINNHWKSGVKNVKIQIQLFLAEICFLQEYLFRNKLINGNKLLISIIYLLLYWSLAVLMHAFDLLNETRLGGKMVVNRPMYNFHFNKQKRKMLLK